MVKKNREKIRKAGRPEKPIDWELVDKLLLAGCSGTEIASHFHIHWDTFYKRVHEKYGILFTEYSSEKRQKGDSLLRAKQFEKALKGDNVQLVWLGKNRLKQSDSPSETIANEEATKHFTALISQLHSLQSERKIDEIIKSKE